MKRAKGLVAAMPPITVDAECAAALLGISRSKFYELDSSGQVPRRIRIGGTKRALWSVAELRRWIDADAPAREQWEDLKRRK